jgi:hypothetical protein
MKKALLSLILISCLFACEDQTNLVYVPYNPGGTGGGGVIYVPPAGSTAKIDMSAFRTLSYTNVRYNLTEQQNNLKVENNLGVFNYEKLLRDELTKLNEDFKVPDLDIPAMAKKIAFGIKPEITYNGTAISLAAIRPEVTSYLNSVQISYLNTYLNNMYNAVDVTTANNYYYTAQSSVNNNEKFTAQQKTVVLAWIEYANQFAQSYFKEYSNYVYIDITNTIPVTASSTCKINFKSVWRAGVETAAVGFVTGAYAGAAGGTVVVPGAGTVTGAVGVGIIGLAGGFISGSVTSVVSQGFWGCLMGSPNKAPGTECDNIEWALDHIDYCYQFDRRLMLAI